jgi:hypothetical protein
MPHLRSAWRLVLAQGIVHFAREDITLAARAAARGSDRFCGRFGLRAKAAFGG